MIRLSHDAAISGSFSGSRVTQELVWPCPSEPRKARFILCDEEEVKLWHLLKERGLSMESDLALTKARLKEALGSFSGSRGSLGPLQPIAQHTFLNRSKMRGLSPWRTMPLAYLT